MGGDEFVILRENISKDKFTAEVKDLRQNIKNHEEINVSIGSTWSNSNSNILEHIDMADGSMYINKQNYYKQSGANPKYRKIFLETLLHELDTNCFHVELQPQIDLETHTVHSAEALIRKVGNDGEMLAPMSFIPLYESIGIINYLDIFVFKNICKILHDWEEKKYKNSNIHISVNFSRHTLTHKGIIDLICSLCDEYDIKRDRIIIEITESMDYNDKYQQITIIEEFAKNGFHISLDDFGAGYSNIGMLTETNFNEVKIDKSLVDSIVTIPKTNILVKNILGICSDLKIESSVAEGIETKEQYELLRNLHCKKGQGYYFSKAMSVEEFTDKYIK